MTMVLLLRWWQTRSARGYPARCCRRSKEPLAHSERLIYSLRRERCVGEARVKAKLLDIRLAHAVAARLGLRGIPRG